MSLTRLPGFDLTWEQVMAEADALGPFVARIVLTTLAEARLARMLRPDEAVGS